jgi:hypothetical protein
LGQANVKRSVVRVNRNRIQVVIRRGGKQSMSRSKGVQDSEAGLKTRIIFWFAKRRMGHVPLGARVRAFDPKLLNACVRMDMYAAGRGVVPVVLKELAQLKVAAMVGCPF